MFDLDSEVCDESERDRQQSRPSVESSQLANWGEGGAERGGAESITIVCSVVISRLLSTPPKRQTFLNSYGKCAQTETTSKDWLNR